MLYRITYFACAVLVALWIVAAGVDWSRFPNARGMPEAGFAGIALVYYRFPRWVLLYAPSLLAVVGLFFARPRRSLQVGVWKVLLIMFCVVGTTLAVGIQVFEINRERVQQAKAAAARERGYAVVNDEDGQPSGIYVKDRKSGRVLGMLPQYPRLRAIYASHMRVGDADLSDLQYVRELEVLKLDRTDVTDAGLVHLASCKSLKELQLTGCRISDEGLDDIANLAKLEVLGLSATEVTDAGLMKLQTLRRLEVLRVRATNVTPKGAERLKQALPMVNIDLD